MAVVGAGAIGTALAGALAATGHAVTVCGGRPMDRIELTEDGRARSWPVKYTTDPADIDRHELLVLAVKAQDTPGVVPWLRAVAGPRTTVVVAQNGVEQRERVAPYVGEAHVVPAVVYLNAERTAVGRVVLRHAGEADLSVPDDEVSLDIAVRLRAGGLRVAVEHDFRTVLWSKLLTNITGNPLTALTGRRIEVLREPGVAAVATALLTEAAAVARVEGAALPDDQPARTLRWLQELPDGCTTSMLQDRLAGRPLEYDALTGAVVRAAERHGIPVPTNRTVLALLAAVGSAN